MYFTTSLHNNPTYSVQLVSVFSPSALFAQHFHYTNYTKHIFFLMCSQTEGICAELLRTVVSLKLLQGTNEGSPSLQEEALSPSVNIHHSHHNSENQQCFTGSEFSSHDLSPDMSLLL